MGPYGKRQDINTNKEIIHSGFVLSFVWCPFTCTEGSKQILNFTCTFSDGSPIQNYLTAREQRGSQVDTTTSHSSQAAVWGSAGKRGHSSPSNTVRAQSRKAVYLLLWQLFRVLSPCEKAAMLATSGLTAQQLAVISPVPCGARVDMTSPQCQLYCWHWRCFRWGSKEGMNHVHHSEDGRYKNVNTKIIIVVSVSKRHERWITEQSCICLFRVVECCKPKTCHYICIFPSK